jgi:hypothetical protein
MMSRVVMTQVMMMADLRRVRIAYDDVQTPVDGSKHVSRGNKSAEAQQSEYEWGGPTRDATVSQPIRFT